MTRGCTSGPRLPLAVVLALQLFTIGAAYQPEFTEPIVNLTVPMGRDAVFRCYVHHLGGYRVGWVKADTKAIQAIHDHVITHNPRVSVTHNDHTTWNLHLKNIQVEDAGQYMCQINTDPMLSQVGFLEVVVSPDFVSEETSGDIMVPEGGTVKLTCRAHGNPEPHIQWRREDGSDIVIREPKGVRVKVSSIQGGVLRLEKVSRSEMGAYLCIASNGVPPSISKRIMVQINFHPAIHVPNQLVGAPLGTPVTLECFVESSPRSIDYWVRESGEMLVSSYKYDVQHITKSMFEAKVVLTIRKLLKEDVGSYRCIAKNSLGEVESNVRLYEIPGSTKPYPSLDEEDYNEQFGSAEREQDEEVSNNVVERGRGRGKSHSSAGTQRGTLTKMYENHVPVDPAPNCSSCLVPMLTLLTLLFVRI